MQHLLVVVVLEIVAYGFVGVKEACLGTAKSSKAGDFLIWHGGFASSSFLGPICIGIDT